MSKPVISVVVPVYKVEPYLSRCVDSILGQTFPDLEVILVDDGSPDNCGAICDAYAQKDGRVRVIHKQNGGLSSARNAGIEQARGEYLAFADSDDWLDADMYEILYRELLRHGAQIAECSYRSLFKSRVQEETPCTGACIEGSNLDALEGILDWNHFKPVAWNKLYRRDVVGDIRYPVGKLHEDEYTTYKIFYRASKLVFVDVSKYNYNCSRDDSIMTSSFRESNLDSCFALRERIDFFREHGITELELKVNNVYCWSMLDKMNKAYQNKVRGPKVQQVREMVKRDLPYFESRPVDENYIKQMRVLAQKGLKAYGKMREKQEVY